MLLARNDASRPAMRLHDTTEHPKEYAARWYFAELYQTRHATPDGGAFERFLALSRPDVEWIMTSTRHHRVGQTWEGLYHLLARGDHAFVRDIGVAAATSWASHLDLLQGEARASEPA
jgi:hypothetical protein